MKFYPNPERIREVIGPGGKVINEIIDKTGVQIDIEPDGLVMVTSVNEEGAKKAVEWIKGIVREVQVGEVFEGKVIKILDFGAIVQILPNQDGMIHISELAHHRVNSVSDVVKVGDVVKVKVINAENGRIGLSLKAMMPNDNPDFDRGDRDHKQNHRDQGRGFFNKRKRY